MGIIRIWKRYLIFKILKEIYKIERRYIWTERRYIEHKWDAREEKKYIYY